MDQGPSSRRFSRPPIAPPDQQLDGSAVDRLEKTGDRSVVPRDSPAPPQCLDSTETTGKHRGTVEHALWPWVVTDDADDFF